MKHACRVLALVIVQGASLAMAQVPLPEEAASTIEHESAVVAAAGAQPDIRWETLRELRLDHHSERRVDGWLLTGWGVVSAVGGLVMSIAGRNDAFWLSQGLTHLSFAAFNIPLGIGLLDVSGSRLQDIRNDRHGEFELYDEVLDAAISAQTSKRASLAVNGALDVLYIVGGVLLVGLASRTSSQNTAAGAGWAMIGQGAVLLAFDVYGVIETSRRARELRRLRE